jgi:hypothetical protein
LLTKAHDAYELNMDKTVKNAITSANKKTAFAELKHFMVSFIDYLVLCHLQAFQTASFAASCFPPFP